MSHRNKGLGKQPKLHARQRTINRWNIRNNKTPRIEKKQSIDSIINDLTKRFNIRREDIRGIEVNKN